MTVPASKLKPALPAALPWKRRWYLAVLAFAGSALYAVSFWPTALPDGVKIAAEIGACAGLAWVGFGFMAWACTRKPLLLLADVCLGAMAWGIAVKLLAVLFNLLFPLISRVGAGALALGWREHALVLLAANIVMAIVFVRGLRRLGVSPGAALALWIVGLDGLFTLLLGARWLGR